jgi:hypothetical protein
MGITRTRIAVSVSASIAVVATVAGTAGARIPEGDMSPGRRVQPAVVALPDAVDRAVRSRTKALEATFAGPDAVARAIARRNR